ncbi:MAG: ribonuclease III [Burkholderiaceae bacterium]
MSVTDLETKLGYRFQNPDLRRLALTHRSHSAQHNERLEFLGDSVLNLAVAGLLYRELSGFDEGDLSRVRSSLVRQQALHDIAQTLSLHQHLHLGEGELKSGGRRRPSILADALEALFGAIFLDGGFDAAATVIDGLYSPILKQVDPRTLGKDAKTLLQEFLQGHGLPLPAYQVVATSGAAHNQMFEVECSLLKLNITVLGNGASRRAAEQAAATKAFEAAQQALSEAPKKRRRSRKSAEPAPQAKLAFSVSEQPESGASVTSAKSSAEKS